MSDGPITHRGPARPVGFKRHLRAEVVPGDATYLLSDAGVAALPGDDLAQLAPLLDGSRDLDAVLGDIAQRLPPARTGQLIGQLMAAGFVRYHDGPSTAVARAEEAYWDLAGLDGSAVPARLASATVDVLCLGAAEPHLIVTALDAAGVRAQVHPQAFLPSASESGAARSTLGVVLTDDYLRPELTGIDRYFADAGAPWLLARPDGAAAWIGPLFGTSPSDAAASDADGNLPPCYECLAHRLRANRARETPLRRGGNRPCPPPTHTPVTAALGAQLIALAVTQHLAGLHRPASVAVHDTVAGTRTDHELRRRPQCPVCGDSDLVRRRTTEPVRIRSRPKSPSTTTGHRSHTSAQTLDTYRHLVGRVTGVVPEIRRDERVPDGMFVYVAGGNPGFRADSRAELNRGLRQLCGGKGMTREDSEASALCEALERLSAQLHGDELRISGSLTELEDALDPTAIQLFDERQFGTNTATTPHFQLVPDRFDPDAVIDWTPVWSMTRERHVLLPTALVYYTTPAAAGVTPVRGSRTVVADSNGNAAGSSLEDAILQGFLEIVERDAVAIWWYNRTRQPGLDLDAFADPWVSRQVELHASLGRELTALDVTTDLEIPVVAVVSRRVDGMSEDLCFGFGAHLDPAVALRRATAEVAQLLPAALPGPGGRAHASLDPELNRWWDTATTATHPYLVADPSVPARTPCSWNYRPHDDLADDLADVTRVVRAHRLELLVLDQTRPDIGLPVVKVIVPGLRHFWRRLAPGRLYDVPVALGRLAEPTPYEQLNPTAMFL